MSQISTLITGAGVVTPIAGLSYCPEFLLIGDVDTANPLQGLEVIVDGTPFTSVNGSAPLVGAYSKWLNEIAGANSVGTLVKLATGRVDKPTTIRLTNAGATTPAIYAFSDSDNGSPMLASTQAILAGSSQDFSKFSALFITAPANILYAEVFFTNGYKETMTAVELDAYFNLKYNSDADGRLNACTVIDNTDQSIEMVRLYATGANLTVLIAKVPDAVFEAVKEEIEG